MNFVKFIDNRFQEISKKQMEGAFSILKDGETQALQFVLSVYRFIFKVLFIPKVFIDYALTLLGLRQIPMPALDIMKAQMADAANANLDKAKKAQKLGFTKLAAVSKGEICE